MEVNPVKDNGGGKHLQPSYPNRVRRGDDDAGADYRYVRRSPPPPDGGGGYSVPVTAAMVSLVVGTIMLAANWLGFTRGEIDRAISPLEEEIFNLQSAHGRLDDKVSREIARLDHEKVDNTISLERLAELNRRLATLERIAESIAERANVVLQQTTSLSDRIEDLRQRFQDHERRAPHDGRYGGSLP